MPRKYVVSTDNLGYVALKQETGYSFVGSSFVSQPRGGNGRH